jgi:Met-zincin/Domain of unknown function (DUF5117)
MSKRISKPNQIIFMKKLMLFGLAACLSLTTMHAQKENEKPNKRSKSKKEAPKEDKKEEDKFGDLIKKCSKSDGLFAIYRDTTSGKSYLLITEAQLNKDFIYFNHIEDAPVEAGYFRGSFGDSKVIRFQKVYERIEIVQDNTNFYYDPQSELSKAADANINDPLLASEKIEAISKDKKSFLIDGDAVFLSEKFQIIKYSPPPGMPGGPLGQLSSGKTRLTAINNYPQNTEVTVAYVYDNGSPTMYTEALADPRYITVKYQHSILEMPKNNYQPRLDDPRIGYFSTQVNDMTSFSATPYRDVIHRWHLEKKDPKADVSEPVEPIVYWIENTTPKELRPIIKEACERWNVAFEGAGFRNAVVCKEQPDDATWSAGDIRYNVLRWTSSPLPPFGGYGPSFVNPRTGQILGADIMLEFVAIVNRVNAEKVFKSTGYLNDDELEKQLGVQIRNPFFCLAAAQTNHNLVFGSTATDVLSMDAATDKEIVRQLLYRLVLHEVGHTLGLTHNMRASTMSTMADAHDPVKAERDGLANSVMEYPAFNYQKDPKQQTIYCDIKPGPYDYWVIDYGYSQGLNDPLMESKRLSKITDKSTDPKLAYGNDADDMRSSGRGIDPDVNIYDLTNDPVAYAAERCDLVNHLLPKMKDRFEQNNKSYEELLQAYLITTGEYGTQLRIMTRQIAGVHYDRSFGGQQAPVRPLEPVSEDKQRAAMKALDKYAFSPTAFDAGMGLLNYLLEQRRGFSHFSNNQDPHLHQRILGMQRECLNHLLHPTVLQRMLDSKLYGNTYTIDEYFTDLTNSIFQADLKTPVVTLRQNLQIEYVNRMVEAFGEKSRYDHVSKSMMVGELKRIDSLMAANVGADALTKAHREHIRMLIRQVMEK